MYESRDVSQPKRIAVVVSHPIQYYVTLYRALAQSSALKIKVFFASRIGLEEAFDREMNVNVAWATDLTGGYDHEFLPEADSIREIGFRSVDNPSVTTALSRFQPDAIVIHGYAMLTTLRALGWSRLHGVKAILVSDSSSHGSPPGLRRGAKLALVPLLLRQFAAALTMSDRAEAHLASLYFPRSRMFRTPMMIDEGFWRARDRRLSIRSQKRPALGLSEDDFVLLCVGKLHPRKRMLNVLEALARLPAKGPGSRRCTLMIAGDGEERDMLQAYVAEHALDVRFLGFVNIDGLPALYSAADLFVHSAEIEQYGMVVLEAAVLGLPMILSDRVGAIGPTSIARADVNAIVYPFGDIDALARSIARLREDDALRMRMADASLQISQDHSGPMSVAAVVAASA
jgi:glycosyltransferase involved in cell wall biosynthesis